MSKALIRVLYDEQIFLLQEYGGISRYFTELIKVFESNPDLGIQPLVASKTVLNRYLLEETKSLPIKRLKNSKAAIFYLAFQVLFNRQTFRAFDLVHYTFYLPGFFNRFGGRPKVVTLFDMIPEKTQKKVSLWNDHFAKRHILPKADLILSISQSSTEDMLREYRINRDVPTTYLGVGPEFQKGLQRLSWLPENYFLFVGNRGGYKDCKIALLAFSKISHLLPEVQFQLVGGGELQPEEVEYIQELGLTGKVQQQSVDSSELPNVYSGALGLIYPSRYEGFGLPLVEGMASGTPVIASDTPINKEIAGDAVSYFPIGDDQTLGDLLVQLATKPNIFDDKINKGLDRAQIFTWYKCAERTAAEYRRIMDKKKEKHK